MKPKFSAAALKAMALEGRLSACEMRAFAARHAATLDADNHAAFVEAFLVQLGAPEQHARILELLATCGRDFHAAQGRIAYRPPGAAQLRVGGVVRQCPPPMAWPMVDTFGCMGLRR